MTVYTSYAQTGSNPGRPDSHHYFRLADKPLTMRWSPVRRILMQSRATAARSPPCPTRNSGLCRYCPESYQRSMDEWAERRPWIDPTAVDLPSSLQNDGAGLRDRSVNPAIRFGRIIRNKLDGDGCCRNVAFVPHDLQMAA